jgi:hypothetical protein
MLEIASIYKNKYSGKPITLIDISICALDATDCPIEDIKQTITFMPMQFFTNLPMRGPPKVAGHLNALYRDVYPNWNISIEIYDRHRDDVILIKSSRQ